MGTGRTVALTGGCGSIGTAVTSALLTNSSIDTIRIFDHDDHGILQLEQQFEEESDRLEMILGDIRETDEVERAFRGVDDVIHAAALKHVPANEANPYKGIKTNTLGTKRVIDAADLCGVNRVLGVSTDKAANPTSVMGATKMLSERLFTDANQTSESTVYGSIRLGNVLNTSASVVPIFREQIANGGPVTLTHPEMTRFAIAPTDAAEFIVESLERISGGEIVVPKMDALRIADLADVMIETTAPEEVAPDEIKIEIVGRRSGERIHERLLTEMEAETVRERSNSLVIPPNVDHSAALASDGGRELSTSYHSGRAEHLTHSGIAELLERSLM